MKKVYQEKPFGKVTEEIFVCDGAGAFGERLYLSITIRALNVNILSPTYIHKVLAMFAPTIS